MMKNLINRGDFIDIYHKWRENRKLVTRRINIHGRKRTQHAFDTKTIPSSDFWIIPMIKKHWNALITGDKEIGYEPYIAQKYLKERKGLTMLSVGCGSGSHELTFAGFPSFEKITGIDVAPGLIDQARRKAKELHLQHVEFQVADFYHYEIPVETFDVVLFHSSLHHFNNLERLLKKVKTGMKKGGWFIMHEYTGPNRFQFSEEQILNINRLLKEIPEKYRKMYMSNGIKKKAFAPGLLRMVVSDPSEAIASKKMLPEIRKQFQIIEEKPLGGNFLMLLFKGIAHHFVENNLQTEEILNHIFRQEEKYLQTHPSDFTFLVAKK